MSRDGFGARWREGQRRMAARNVAEMRGQTLEGPGAEKRLARIQRRFRELNARRQPHAAELLLMGVGVFVAVFVIGMLALG